MEDEAYVSQPEDPLYEMQQEAEQEVQPHLEMEAPREAEDETRGASQSPRQETAEESQQIKTKKRKKERETSSVAAKEKFRKQRKSQDTSRNRLSQETFRRGSDYFDAGLGFDLDTEFDNNRDSNFSVPSFTSQERESFISDISSSSEDVLYFSALMKNCRRREVFRRSCHRDDI